jgi:hypothetical protein
VINTTLSSDNFQHYKVAAQVTGLTREEIQGSFYVITTIGCFFEQTIVKTVTPLSDAFDIIIALQPVDQNDASTIYFTQEISYDLFTTEITDCYASRLALCEDAACTSQLNQPYLFFTENPTESSISSFPVAQLNIDRRNTTLDQEFFIIGSTLDPNINDVISGRVISCQNEKFRLEASDDDRILQTRLKEPINVEKIVDVLTLFR